MMFHIFEWTGDQMVIALPEVLLFPEFDNLWNNTEFNKCKSDKKGVKHIKSSRVFKFIWMVHDYKSPYMEYDEEERTSQALRDSKLIMSDVTNPIVVAAIAKYQNLQDTRLLKLLRTANKTVDKIRVFLDEMDLDERDVNDKLVHNSGNVMKQIGDLGRVSEGMKDLEYQVKKEMETAKTVRGEIDLGLFDND
jgi:hypothetical protein